MVSYERLFIGSQTCSARDNGTSSMGSALFPTGLLKVLFWQIRRGALFRPGAGGHHPSCGSVSAAPQQDEYRRRLVSLEVSRLLAHDTASTLREAKDLFPRAARPNMFIKIPGTKEGLPAIEEAILPAYQST
jgi:hypothetical protein